MNAKRMTVAAAVAVAVAIGVSPVRAQVEHCTDITRNTTWGPEATHIINDGCTVNVRNSTLQILPGALIQMGQGANLVFQAGGELQAIANANSGIRIMANSREEPPGYWGQIRFEAGAKPSVIAGVLATGNVIVPVTIRSGGKDGVPMVDVRNEKVEFDWTLMQKAGDIPLAFAAAALGPSLEVPGGSTVGVACQRVQLGENTVPGILVRADQEIDIATSTNWSDFCVPYFVDQELRVGGVESPTLKVGSGVEVHLGPDGSLAAGVDEDTPGTIDIAGTVPDPILITGREAVPGAWRGIVFGPYSGLSSIYNAAVEYGGRDDEPMVTVLSPEASALGAVFRNAKAVPLEIAAQAVSTFTYALALTTGEEDPVFEDNGVQRVLVRSADDPVLGEGSSWADLGVPFELDGSLIVAGATGPRLSILAGAELVFPPGGRLVVGGADGPGELNVLGEPDRPVVLTGRDGTPGSWAGVQVTNEARAAYIDRAVIEYGGAPMVEWGRVTGDVSRVTFRGAAGYPISVPAHFAHDVILDPEVPDEEPGVDLSSTFEDNAQDRVLVRVERNYSIALSTWRDPGAPVEFDDTLVVSSPTQPLLELGEGLTLLFRAGETLDLGTGEEGRASLLVSLTEADNAPVTLGPADAAKGWGGLRVRRASSLRATGPFEVAGVGDEHAAIAVEEATATLHGTTLSNAGRGTGLRATGAATEIDVQDARVTGNRVGLHTSDGARLAVTRTVIQGNIEWGMRNDDPDLCLKAPLVYWGHADGPNDVSDTDDGCINGANANPDGDKVSDDVDWWPYAVDTNWTPSGGLGPNPWTALIPFCQRGN